MPSEERKKNILQSPTPIPDPFYSLHLCTLTTTTVYVYINISMPHNEMHPSFPSVLSVHIHDPCVHPKYVLMACNPIPRSFAFSRLLHCNITRSSESAPPEPGAVALWRCGPFADCRRHHRIVRARGPIQLAARYSRFSSLRDPMYPEPQLYLYLYTSFHSCTYVFCYNQSFN